MSENKQRALIIIVSVGLFLLINLLLYVPLFMIH